MDLLLAYTWPGNVRELLHCIEYAVNIMEGGIVRAEHLPPYVHANALELEPPLATPSAASCQTHDQLTLPPQGAPPEASGETFRLHEVAADTIREALAFHGGNISRTAKALGIGRNTLYAKMRKFGLRP